MEYVRFGRTELRVSVMGLGCGGPSRIGQNTDRSEAESVAIIRTAIDAGVNFIDTSEAYRTEPLVGKALQHYDRDRLVISTKKSYHQGISAQSLRTGLERSLERLGTDYVDIYNLHAVRPDDYPMLRDTILPVFAELREEGKLRYIGVTESFNEDPGHRMLTNSLPDNLWDVVMVGFNILNQSAREQLFARTQAQDVAVQVMFAVRRAFSQTASLIASLRTLVDKEQLDPNDIDWENPLGFVLEESDAKTLTDAAYRFCSHELGVHVVLSGTGNPTHLRENIASLERPPLPESVLEKLRTIFRSAISVTGQ